MPPDHVVLRLVTANAASGRDPRGRPAYDAWVAAAAAAQAGLGADVWAVQEVDDRQPRSGGADQTAVLGAALAAGGAAWDSRFTAAVRGTPGSGEPLRPVVGPGAGGPAYGVALHSRHPVLAREVLRLAPASLRLPVPLPPGSGSRVRWVPDEPRVAVAAVLGTPAGEVSVVTTHLSFAPWRARAQLREVVAWAAWLPRPLVLLGDLNLRGRTPARVSGMQPAGGDRARPTYPAHRPRWRLDHALLDPGGSALGLAETALPRLGGSDHLGVCVELRTGPTVGGRG